MTVVTNTGPLIMLAKIDQLVLLQKMFATIFIPPAVHRELMAKTGSESRRLDAALAQFIEVTVEPEIPSVVEMATQHLDEGERQAIALAHASGSILAIDERLGPQAARLLHLTVTGSVGLLLESKRRDYIPAVTPLLQEAPQQGYWLSDRLIVIAANLAEESSGKLAGAWQVGSSSVSVAHSGVCRCGRLQGKDEGARLAIKQR
ncbi:MAG: hypothetical protein Fur0021_14940 [Candidatus Promineifilaceae bacterium]